MPSGSIDVTPGRVLSTLEKVDNQKLNDLGRPILRVQEAAITSRELAPGSIDSDKLNVDLEAQIGVTDGSVTTAKIVDGAVTSSKLASEAAIPTGVIFDFAGATPPGGWLLCYGQAISRATYSVLFGIIGTVYGNGDGSTTFNIPDMRGRVGAGKDNMGGASASRLSDSTVGGHGIVGNTLGDTGGTQTHVLTTAEIPSHNHTFSDYYQISVQAGQPGTIAFENDIHFVEQGAYLANSTAYTGSNVRHNNCQPTMIVNKIIKAT